MKIGELRQRENFDSILLSTLSTAFSGMANKPIQVESSKVKQAWREDKLLSIYIKEPNDEVRRFLKSIFCYTPYYRRLPLQYLLGNFLCSSYYLNHFSTSAFITDKELPNFSYLMIQPGNRRLRIYDFLNKKVSVYTKSGFSSLTMKNELEARRKMGLCAVPVLRASPQADWFEEPILNGYVLNRLPPWKKKAPLLDKAFRELKKCLEKTYEEKYSVEWAGKLINDSQTILNKMDSTHRKTVFAPLEQWWSTLEKEATRCEKIALAQGHGDFQAGNVFITLPEETVYLLDWEFSGKRMYWYDYLVFMLGLRQKTKLFKNLRNFLCFESNKENNFFIPNSNSYRRSILSFLLLEEIKWLLEENTLENFKDPTPSVKLFFKEMATCGVHLERLFD